MKFVLFLLFLVLSLVKTQMSFAIDQCSRNLTTIHTYEKWASEIPGPQGTNLSAREMNAIYYYTETDSVRINQTMRKWALEDVVPEVGTQSDIATLINGLKKIVPYQGKVKRFSKRTLEQIDSMTKGHEFKLHAFWSSTTLDELPPSVNTQNMNVVFVIQGKSGRSIADLSHHPDEKEVLFMPLTKFRVLDSVANGQGGRHVITLQEID